MVSLFTVMTGIERKLNIPILSSVRDLESYFNRTLYFKAKTNFMSSESQLIKISFSVSLNSDLFLEEFKLSFLCTLSYYY